MCLKNELSTMINNCATIILISAFFFRSAQFFWRVLYKRSPEVKKNQKTFLDEYIFISYFLYIMIFCAISIQNTQGPIGPGQWKLGLKYNSKSHLTFTYKYYCAYTSSRAGIRPAVHRPSWFDKFLFVSFFI
jgi:hypothetical protein